MSTTTNKLKLFKYDPVADANSTFNITNALNNNFDNIESKTGLLIYDNTATYALGDWVLGVVDNERKFFESLANSNTGNALTDTTKWEEVKLGGNSRNIGEIIQSTIPLTDAGLHLLDGSLLQYGSYQAFIDYIADLYTADPTASCFAQSTDLTWTQPVLSANGTAGGDDFAIFADSERGASHAYYTMDGNTSYLMSWCSNTTSSDNYIGFYNPTPLKVTQLTFLNYSNTADSAAYCTTAGKVQVSSDGTTWTDLKSYTNSTTTNGQTWSIDLSDNTGYYKYYRIYSISNANSDGWIITELTINAVYSLTAEEYWQHCITNYGVCGKFVYDSVNNTVRLPKITGFTEGTIDATSLGDLTEAGLPNITGTCAITTNSGTTLTGALYGEAIDIGETVQSASGYTLKGIDASLSNPIYGNSNTVQTQSIKVLYYIVIATSTKTDIQVDIDEIATDLNGKADTDLSNVPNSKGILTESYINGTSWYRVYSDGWCEQGGYIVSTGSTTTVSLLKPYRDTNYWVSSYMNNNSSGGALTNYGYAMANTTTNFLMGSYVAGLSHRWHACGYIR